MDATRSLDIESALVKYAALTDASCCTTYVIIKETTGTNKFGVVPKISCCISRALKQCCGSANYYTRDQADMATVAGYIKALVDSEMEVADGAFEAMDLLTSKFGTAADVFNTAGVRGVQARRAERARRKVDHAVSAAGLSAATPVAAISPTPAGYVPIGVLPTPLPLDTTTAFSFAPVGLIVPASRPAGPTTPVAAAGPTPTLPGAAT